MILHILVVTLFLLYELLKPKDDYFVLKQIPFLKPSFLVGSRLDILLRHRPLTESISWWYNEFPDAKVIGLFEFWTPAYLIRDPKLLKKLTVRDFDSFCDHRMFLGEDVDPLFDRALFNLQGQKWRDMRATLSPAFTGSKMRQMFKLISSVGEQVALTLKTQIENGGDDCFEFKDLARKFTVDTIATCAFGIEVNSFANPENDFLRIANKLANFNAWNKIIKFVGYFVAPKLMRAFKIKFFEKEVTDYFQRVINETMEVRERDGIKRHDMVNLLIQAKRGKLKHEKESATIQTVDGFATVQESQVGREAVKRKWDDDDLYAQCFIFFFAGFDTVSTVISFMAHEIMINTDIQTKLQNEIDELHDKLDGRRVNYEQVQGLKYMDQVVCETLRCWPPGPIVDRACVRNYQIEYDDKRFIIEKGKHFYIPIYAIHHDERYFEDPEKFDPERFSEENRRKIDPDTFIPFGLGPRNCIASRFALMELKTIMYYLLLNFEFVPKAKTQIPLKLARNPSQLQSQKGIWVGFKPRK